MGGTHLYAGIVTALYERDRSGVGRLVEIAMQEAVYYTLAAAFEQAARASVDDKAAFYATEIGIQHLVHMFKTNR